MSTLTCKHCGKESFIIPSRIKYGATFCNRKCYNAYRKSIPRSEIFWNRVEKTDSCWMWKACTNKVYGIFFPAKKERWYAHRYSYFLSFGKIPENMSVLHKCDTPLCVNPEHLFIGTQQDNMKDMKNKNRGVKGETQGGAKLKENDIIEIRKKALTMTHAEICKSYNVNRRTIGKIVNYDRWKHVI